MHNYPIHTIASAPENSKSALEQLKKAFGVVPNLAAAIANSPKLINSLVGVFQQVHSSSLTEQEIQIVLLTDAVANSSTYAVAFHTALALQQGVSSEETGAIREGRVPTNKRLAALSTLAKALIEKTWTPERTRSRFVPRCRFHEGTSPGGYRHSGSLDDHKLCGSHRQSATGRSLPAARLASLKATHKTPPQFCRSYGFADPVSDRRRLMMGTEPNPAVPQLVELLRYWRHERGKSQLDLSMDTGISQRHLSFVESGRSAPSRDFLSIVSDALNIPLRERNVLLLASGYAPQYSGQGMDAEQMAVVTRAIDRMLQQHEPHPALVLDRNWYVIRTNEAAPRFFGSFLDLEKRPKPRNLLDLMFDPAGMRPFVENWQKVAAGLLQRVRREAVGQVLNAELQKLLKQLRGYPGVAELKPSLAPQSPVLPIVFRQGNRRFSYFSLITTVGTPQCITAQELRVECMFPTDVDER